MLNFVRVEKRVSVISFVKNFFNLIELEAKSKMQLYLSNACVMSRSSKQYSMEIIIIQSLKDLTYVVPEDMPVLKVFAEGSQMNSSFHGLDA